MEAESSPLRQASPRSSGRSTGFGQTRGQGHGVGVATEKRSQTPSPSLGA